MGLIYQINRKRETLRQKEKERNVFDLFCNSMKSIMIEVEECKHNYISPDLFGSIDLKLSN